MPDDVFYKVSPKAGKPFIHNINPNPAFRRDQEFVRLVVNLNAISSPLKPKLSGGARRVRTDDLMLAKHALYQLSYGPKP